MRPIELDLMLDYRYLSDLKACHGKLFFVDTLADIKANDYTQRLHAFDPKTKEDKVLYEDKRVTYTIFDDQIMILKSEEKAETTVYRLEDGLKKAFHLPLEVKMIKDVDASHYFIEATIDHRVPDLYALDVKDKEAYDKRCQEDEDYVLLDEYPFFFNGAGFINGKRNAGFIVDKDSLKIKRITPATMDIESAIFHDDQIYLLANDYESMKLMWSKIYVYDVTKDELKMIYDNKDMFISRIVMVHDDLYALASKDTCIGGKSFYKVTSDGLKLVYATESMFGSSIGSDCRYGRSTSSITHDGDLYILNTVDERSVVQRFDGKELTFVTDFEGSVDDMTFNGDDLYIIAMKDMKLQEVYEAKDEVLQLTHLNEDVLTDKYVARPEKLTCFNVHELRGWVLKPYDFDPNKTYPAILDIHGGPKTAYGEVFYHEMQYWASKGYFVFFLNPHCSDGRGDEFADYLKHYGATDYDDIMVFTDEVLKRYPNIDPQRLGVTGGSYGGYMTNWIITHTDRFKCAASQRSISNRVADFYYSDYSYDTTYENGIPLDQRAIDLFWDRSPLKYVEKAVTPTLFIHATEDYRCPFPEALQLFSALKWKGVDTKICGFKGENHELSRSGKPKHRLRRIQEITAWMDYYLKDQ